MAIKITVLINGQSQWEWTGPMIECKIGDWTTFNLPIECLRKMSLAQHSNDVAIKVELVSA